VRQVDVTEADVLNVTRFWRQLLADQDAPGLNELPCLPVWHIFEAEEYLIKAAFAHHGITVPTSVTFSAMDTIEENCECEVLFFWAAARTIALSLGHVVSGTAVRVDEYKWPGRDLFVKTADHIKYVIWRVSLLKDALVKEGAVCILGK